MQPTPDLKPAEARDLVTCDFGALAGALSC